MRTVLALAGSLLLAACAGPRPLLDDVRVAPAAITPDGDGDADVARISYVVGQPAQVSIHLTAADGTDYLFRDAQPRQPGQFDALFGGVIDGRMLPAGSYAVTVSAVPANGGGEALTSPPVGLTLTGGDEAAPVIGGFTLDQPRFTPNQDGLADGVLISYTLDEPLAGFRLWLETADGEFVSDIVQARETADDPTRPGAHSVRYDAGVDADAPPPPNGEYRVVAEATDAAGNVTREQLPLTIADAGKPSVALKGDVTWSDKVVPLGATLFFTATVENMGDTPIRTRGPEPGFRYDNRDSFNQVAPLAVLLLAREGGRATSVHVPISGSDLTAPDLDLSAGALLVDDSAGYPPDAASRPGRPTVPLGTPDPSIDTPPTVKLCGRVRDGGRAVADAEVFAFEADGDNGLRTTTDAAGRYCFDSLAIPPALERNFAQSSGALRLGVKYDDARQTLDYPYRWQLGRTADLDVCATEDRLYLCLPPGKQVQVTGGIRFTEPPYRRSTSIYLGLIHEDVRVPQAGYGRQQLLVEH